MNSNRSSNQSQGKAKGKNRPKNSQKAPKAPRQRQAPKKGRQAAAAAAYATQQVGQSPKINQETADTTRIRHREFIGNVTGSTAFTIANTFAVNPGLQATFPWLSQMAAAWETYRFRYLRFCFYTRTGTNVPGSVLLALDPDASDAAPASEQVMSTYENVMEDAPWKDICLDTKKAVLHELGPKRFVRTGTLAANQDIKLYDVGNLFVGTVDGTAVAWGKLWVEYDVDLFTPQQPAGGFAQQTAMAVNATASGATASGPLGNNANIVITGNLISSVAAPGANSVVSLSNLTIGNEYVLLLGGTAAALTENVAPFTALVGLTLKTTLSGNVAHGGQPGVTGITVTATATSGSAQPQFTTLTTPTVTYVMVAQVPVSGI